MEHFVNEKSESDLAQAGQKKVSEYKFTHITFPMEIFAET